MKILIIGGTGVISFAVVNESIKHGHTITCINRGKSKSQKLPQEAELIVADYRNKNTIEEKLKNRHFDVIVDFLCMNKNDIKYSVNLFKDKCNQYIFISSCAVYKKHGNSESICDENSSKITPSWDYSIEKMECENYLIQLSKIYNFNYTIVRPAVTYGNTRIPYGITPSYGYHGTILQRLIHNKPIILWDNGESYYNLTRVEDFAIGFVGLYGNPKALNEAFNIVGDETHTWKEVIELTAKILNVTPKYFNISSKQFAKELPEKKGEISGRAAKIKISNEKLKSLVPQFKTYIPLKKGIEMTIRYYIENDYLYGIDYAFDGDWDRIIAKYDKNYTPRFIDYLNNASQKDKESYYNSLNKNIYIENIKKKIYKLINKTKRIIKCILKK